MMVRRFLLSAALAWPGVALAQAVTEVQVAPPSVTIKVGERNGLLATAFDRVGNVIPTARVIWSSNNVAVAKVDNNGTVTGIGGGVAIIEARVGARKGTAAVQVVGSPPAAAAANPATQPAAPAHPTGEPAGAPGPDPLAGQLAGTGPAAVLRIEPPTIYLLPSENTRAAPRALKDDGTPAAPVPVTWKSLRPDIASVDQNGVIVALAPGQGTVQVTSAGGLTATAPVVVQQAEIAVQEPVPLVMSPGDVDTLHVAVPSQGGRLVSPLALQWSTADATVARVNLTGIVTPVAPGRTTLTVAGLLQTKTVEVVVHRTVEQLAVSPSYKADVPLPIQGTVKFTVQGLAADRTPVPEAQFRWIVGDTTLAGFDPAAGTLTGKRAGKTTLTVKGPGPGLSVTWPIRVIAAGLKLSASRLGVSLARHVPLRASFADESGGVIGPATGVSWASDNPSVATVAEDGTVATTGYGHARVTATAPGGRRAVAEVFVQGEIVVASSRSGRLQLYAAERANLAQLRKVMDDTATATEPAFSPDGSRIAFTSTRDGQPEVYVMDADGTNAQRLTNSPGLDGDPSFSADGQAVLFHSQRTAHRQIYVQPITSSVAVPLSQEPADNSQPSMSPDGEVIAFVSNRDGNTHIWLMAKDGTNQHPFTRGQQTKESAPHFLRDGTLAYLVEQKEGGRTSTQVVKADLTTGKIGPLAATDLMVTDFAVSGVGDLLGLVVAVQKNVLRVYIQPIGAGGAPVAIPTSGAEQMVSPAFMP